RNKGRPRWKGPREGHRTESQSRRSGVLKALCRSWKRPLRVQDIPALRNVIGETEPEYRSPNRQPAHQPRREACSLLLLNSERLVLLFSNLLPPWLCAD